MSGRMNMKSPRSTMQQQQNFSAQVAPEVSGTKRQRQMTAKDIQRIQNNPKAGRFLND